MLSPQAMALKSKLHPSLPGLPSPTIVSSTFSIPRLHPRGWCLFLEYPGLSATSGPLCSGPSLPHPPLPRAGSFPSFRFCQNTTSSMKPSLTTLVTAAAHTSVAF